MTDPRGVRTTSVTDQLWLRVLDVPTALEARPWGQDGSVVVAVDDPLGHGAGGWQVTTRDGRAEVVATGAEPDVRLGIEALSSLYLGGVDATTLHEAGRITGTDQGVATWAAMTRGGPPPYCITGF